MPLTDTSTNAGELKLQRLARKRAGAKMGWFIHATVYVLVNTWLALIAASGSRPWHLYPLAGWGVGLALHAMAVWWLGSGATLRESLVERELRRLRAQQHKPR